MLIGRMFRLGAILIIATGVVFFGLHFGPAQHRGGVEAKVFERLFLLTKDMPEYLFYDRTTSDPRKVKVNGNTTHMRVGKTYDDIGSVLDFYAKQYSPLKVRLVDEDVVDKIEDEETKACVQRAVRFVECLGKSQHFRFDRRDFGFWSGFEFHDADLEIGTEEFIHTTEAALSSGKLGQLGIGRAVIAMRDPGEQETTVITMWTDRDFDLNSFNSNSFGDVACSDLELVPRYPGSRMILSIEQENSRTRDSVAVYEGGGSLATNILFYHGRMKQSGFCNVAAAILR